MLFTEYLDTIENTEQEQQFLQNISEAKEAFQQAAKIPFVGKMLRALVALIELESIEEFKQSEHYENIKDYDIRIDNFEKGHFSILPGKEHKKKLLKLMAVIAIGILLLVLCKKCRCNRD